MKHNAAILSLPAAIPPRPADDNWSSVVVEREERVSPHLTRFELTVASHSFAGETFSKLPGIDAMKSLVVLFAAMFVSAHAQDVEPVTVPITLNVEVVDYQKVCDKAVAVIASKYKLTADEARDHILVPGDVALRQEKCLEAIFSQLSSPTNGYRVHVVTSDKE